MKKAILITVVALLCLTAIGGKMFNNIFPESEPLICPTEEEITLITLSESGGESVTVKTSDFSFFLEALRSAEPTRNQSIHDSPLEESYYTLELHTAEINHRYYLYEKNPLVYLESPYVGVYTVNRQLLTLAESYFKS